MSKYFCFVDYNGDYVVCRSLGNGECVILERVPYEDLAQDMIGSLQKAA